MKYKITSFSVAAAILVSMNAYAASETIKISDAWAWPTVRSAKVGGVYLTIKNEGSETDRLLSVTTDEAEKVQLRTLSQGSVPQLRDLESGLEIPAGQTVTLSPDSTHLALKGLKEPLQKGGEVHLTLQFKKAGTINATANVMARGYTGKIAP